MVITDVHGNPLSKAGEGIILSDPDSNPKITLQMSPPPEFYPQPTGVLPGFKIVDGLAHGIVNSEQLWKQYLRERAR